MGLVQRDVGTAAHDVVVNRKAAVGDGLEERVAQLGAVVEVFGGGGFEGEASQRNARK